MFVDRGIHEALVQADDRTRPRQANVRYLLVPAVAGRRFHPKILLFVDEDRGLLLTGSANLTRAGLSWNAELVAAHRYARGSAEREGHLFRAAFRFIREVAKRSQNTTIEQVLADVSADADWLIGDDSAENVRLVHNYDESIWDQVCRDAPRRPDVVHVLSPFFDPVPDALDRIHEDLSPRQIVIWTESRVGTLTPTWLRHDLVRRGRVKIRLCSPEDEGHCQRLHGKAVVVAKGGSARLAYGSANCTKAGMFSTAAGGNVEFETIVGVVRLSGAALTQWLDPSNSSRLLERPGELPAEQPAPWTPVAPTDVLLEAAELDGQRLLLNCSYRHGVLPLALRVLLRLPDGTHWQDAAARMAEGRYAADVPAAVATICGDGSVIACVEATLERGRTLQSNRVFLLNLLDPGTGESARKERQLRDAQRDVVGFHSVLVGLLEAADLDGLRRLLTYCDIRIPSGSAAEVGREFRQPLPQVFGIAFADGRLPRLFGDLHAAAQSFCDRHLRKLKRTSKTPRLHQLGAALSVAIAVAEVAVTQAEREVVALRAADGTMKTSEWSGHMKTIHDYLERLTLGVDYFHKGCVARLLARSSRAEVAKRVGASMGAWRALLGRALAIQPLVWGLQRLTAFRNAYDEPVGGGWACATTLILHPQSWPRFAAAMQEAQREAFELSDVGGVGVNQDRERRSH